MVAEHMLMQMLALAKRLPEVTGIAQAAEAWGQPSRRTDENTFAYNWSAQDGRARALRGDRRHPGLWRNRRGTGAAAAPFCPPRCCTKSGSGCPQR